MKPLSRVVAEVLISILVIYTLVFLVLAVLPVDPARALLGANATEAAVNALRHELGLDQPLWTRYGTLLSRMTDGDFGISFYFRRPAAEIVLELAPVTLLRAALGLALGFVIGLVLAPVAWRYRLTVVRTVFSLLQSVPSFCLMVLLLWLTARGFAKTPLGHPALYEVLTILGAAAYPAGAVGIYVYDRVALIGARPRHADFLMMLHAPRNAIIQILWKEALPGASVIVINAVGIALTAVTFGEIVFGVPGFGSVFIKSCERGDLSVVAAGTILLSILLVLLQRAGDLLSRWIDPRIDYA